MKKNYLYILLISIGCLWACDNQWSTHYSDGGQQVDSKNIAIVDADAMGYLSTEPTYSKISQIFKESGIADLINQKKQEFTILVYPDDALVGADLNDEVYFARTCVCDLAYVPTKIQDGVRLLMWNGKYLTASVAEETGEISFSGIKVQKMVKVNNGYIYQLESPIFAPKSMYEVLSGLGDNYSMFRKMVLGQNTRVFDKANSTPVGVDKAGNTVYDSVFVISNPLFEKIDIMSEFITGTMFIPSDDVLKECLQQAYDSKRFALGTRITLADTVKFETWATQAMFFDRVITPEDYRAESDIKSAFGNQWKTSVQQVDTEHLMTLSNGVAYYVTKMKIPMNQVIFRIKHFFRYWDYCTAGQKAEFYKWANIDEASVKTTQKVVPWTPKAGEWPMISNVILEAQDIDETQPYALEFTALTMNEAGDGVQVAMIPPGEYTLAMGFQQHKSNGYDINIYVNGTLVKKVNLGSGTAFHYDRGSGSYPEGYLSSLNGNYDRDGGTIGTVTFTGDQLQKMVIRIESVGKMPSGQIFDGHHWCLRPTSNNY